MLEVPAQSSEPLPIPGREFWSTFHMLVQLGTVYGNFDSFKVHVDKLPSGANDEVILFENPEEADPPSILGLNIPEANNTINAEFLTQNEKGELEGTEVLTFGEGRPDFIGGADTGILAMVAITYKNPDRFKADIYRFYPDGRILRNPINFNEHDDKAVNEWGPTHKLDLDETYAFQNRLGTAEPFDFKKL